MSPVRWRPWRWSHGRAAPLMPHNTAAYGHKLATAVRAPHDARRSVVATTAFDYVANDNAAVLKSDDDLLALNCRSPIALCGPADSSASERSTGSNRATKSIARRQQTAMQPSESRLGCWHEHKHCGPAIDSRSRCEATRCGLNQRRAPFGRAKRCPRGMVRYPRDVNYPVCHGRCRCVFGGVALLEARLTPAARRRRGDPGAKGAYYGPWRRRHARGCAPLTFDDVLC
jgi:hypothetical protein